MGIISELLFGVRVIVDYLGVPAVTRNRVRFEGAATVADDPSHRETVVTIGGDDTDPTFGNVTADSLTIGSYVLEPQPAVTTVAGANQNLLAAAVSVPSGRSVSIAYIVKSTILYGTVFTDALFRVLVNYRNLSGTVSAAGDVDDGPGTDLPWSGIDPQSAAVTVTGAADNGSGAIRLAVSSTSNIPFAGATVTVAGVVGTGGLTAAVNETWAVDVIDSTHIDLRGSAFAGAWTSGGTVTQLGALRAVISGTTVQLRATGILPAKWIQSEAVTIGEIRYDVTSDKTYICSQSGTTAAMGTGPSGTGNAITDGTAKWDYVGAGRSVTITWQAVKVEVMTT